MESMIERVAQALRKFAAEMEVSSNGEKSPDVMVHSNELARAAIEAMREPTRVMVAKGSWAPTGAGEVGGTGAKNAYRAMIDAALSEPH